MIHKIWAVFQLGESVCDVTRLGIEYANDEHTLDVCYDGVFSTEPECEEYIKAKMQDYNHRGVGKGLRFVIMPVYCFENDELYKLTKE